MTLNPYGYSAAIERVLTGCFPENEHITGATPEYTRGVLNALAEVFPEMDTHVTDRMGEIEQDLVHLAWTTGQYPTHERNA